MTGFSVWNVLIMRKALNSPIVGAEDLLILSLVVIVALSIPLGARTGAHIEIEVFESRMSAGICQMVDDPGQAARRRSSCRHGMAALALRPSRRAVRRDYAAVADFVRAVLLPAFRFQSLSTLPFLLLDIWQLLRSEQGDGAEDRR